MNICQYPAKLHVEHMLMHRKIVRASIETTYAVSDHEATLWAPLPVITFITGALWDEDARWQLEVEGARYPMDLREETLAIRGNRLDLAPCSVEDLIVLYSGEAA